MRMRPPIVAASLLAANFAILGEEVASAEAAGADWLHLDVMDNHYVPNLTFGAPVCRDLRKVSSLPFDVHLMTEKADTLVEPFAAAGADWLTFHPDAVTHPHRTATAIATAGMKVGVALNPAAPLTALDYLLDSIDLVLLMTVNPGFGGQAFIPAVLEKVAAVRRRIDDCGREIRLSVDGGVNAETASSCRAAGADTLIAGNAIFHAADRAGAVRAIRGE